MERGKQRNQGGGKEGRRRREGWEGKMRDEKVKRPGKGTREREWTRGEEKTIWSGEREGREKERGRGGGTREAEGPRQ